MSAQMIAELCRASAAIQWQRARVVERANEVARGGGVGISRMPATQKSPTPTLPPDAPPPPTRPPPSSAAPPSHPHTATRPTTQVQAPRPHHDRARIFRPRPPTTTAPPPGTTRIRPRSPTPELIPADPPTAAATRAAELRERRRLEAKALAESLLRDALRPRFPAPDLVLAASTRSPTPELVPPARGARTRRRRC